MLESRKFHSRMSKLAKDELTRVASLEQMIGEIDRVTTDQVYRVAQTLLDQRCLAITALDRSQRTVFSPFAS